MMMKVWALVFLLGVCSAAEVVAFGETAINAIFKDKKDAFVLFLEAGDSGNLAYESFTSFAEASTLENVIYTALRKEENQDHFSRFASFVGVDVTSTPVALFLRETKNKFLFSGEHTAAAYFQFINGVNDGSIKAFLKSADIPASNDQPVKILVGKSFKETVLDSSKEFLVKFYAPWCGHCKTIAPHFDAAAEALSSNPNVVLAKFDGTENEVEGVAISGYPTIYFYGKDKTVEPISFNGNRDTEGIISWIKDHTEYEWVEPAQPDDPAPEEEL